ncbi:Myb-related protein mybas2 [Thalictrum thalictroides]|uniref:Myb-related protein mybas2 n=1 Tax=Thalictrum thalictroides TaxID=46969 RepID=A0A7J6WRZ0_THATH|nr:Myb-related protein mybas2 [Thalictrum thalictroides]
MVQEETRKGPWIEQEDLQLVYFVGLFGERRWDFIAKVSGLNRTGKSCRLRWVNYLHPGLKRGRMTPQEERLVLELHLRWGNRWSRIARKLPGRTDNEIKNYWRTHMRKKAQERKRALSLSSSSCCSTSPNKNIPMELSSKDKIEEGSSSNDFKDVKGKMTEEGVKGYPMDRIWDEIASSEEVSSGLGYEGSIEEGSSFTCPPMASPPWDYCFDSLWRMDEEEIKLLAPFSDLSAYNYGHSREL